MGRITTSSELRESILALEKKQADQWTLLRSEAGIVYENLKPVNLLKRTLHDLTSADGLMENIISPLVGLATGFVSKKIVVGKSANPFKNILGSLIQAAITNLIIRNPELIKSMGSKLVDKFFAKKGESNQD
jgi:hypothetical protein